MSKMKITGLKLKTKDNKEVSLTLKEAKELHEQLDELFGVKEPEVRFVPTYNPWWNRPYYTWYNQTLSNAGNSVTTTCTSSDTGMSVSYLGKAAAA